MYTEAETKKAMDRIRKCLNLAKSANENEAASALRQAQKLMKEYSLTEGDVSDDEIGNELYITRYPVQTRRAPHIDRIANLIQVAFEVHAIMEAGVRNGNVRQGIRYFGKKQNVIMATYATAVIFTQMGRAWDIARQKYNGAKLPVGYRASFYYGWLMAVRTQIEEFANPTPVKYPTAIKKFYDRDIVAGKPAKQQSYYKHALDMGAAGAEGFSLHRPMDGKAGAAHSQKMLGG